MPNVFRCTLVKRISPAPPPVGVEVLARDEQEAKQMAIAYFVKAIQSGEIPVVIEKTFASGTNG